MTKSSPQVALNSFTSAGPASVRANRVAVKRAAWRTTTNRPSSSYGTPSSRRRSSAGLRSTTGTHVVCEKKRCSTEGDDALAENSCPPSHAPPPGDTDCSMSATLRPGNCRGLIRA